MPRWVQGHCGPTRDAEVNDCDRDAFGSFGALQYPKVGTAKLHVWVQWETGGRLPFGIYCDRMAKPKGQWGGAPEIASMARKEKVDMWVWAPCDVEEGFFVRQHIFKGGPERIDICRVESLHYEYLEIIEGELEIIEGWAAGDKARRMHTSLGAPAPPPGAAHPPSHPSGRCLRTPCSLSSVPGRLRTTACAHRLTRLGDTPLVVARPPPDSPPAYVCRCAHTRPAAL